MILLPAYRAASLILAASLAGCASAPFPESAPHGRYANPVLNSDFPDPAILRAPDGRYYAYATQGVRKGEMLNIQVARSHNLVDWDFLGEALPVKPKWAAGKQNFWAPHVIHDPMQDAYFMYYSAEPDTASGKCLAVAVSRIPAGPFVDSGRALVCGAGLEHIDPMAFDDPQTGKHLLYWGSGAGGIKAQELAPDRLGFLAGSSPLALLLPDPQREYRTLIEGAWVRYRSGTYYLFYSGDRCCTREPRYAVMVARASHALGPYENFSGDDASGPGVILGRSDLWIAPGHNAVVSDDEGSDWMIYHAILAPGAEAPVAQRSRVMLLDRLVYREGWPRVAANQPSAQPRDAPVVRSASVPRP